MSVGSRLRRLRAAVVRRLRRRPAGGRAEEALRHRRRRERLRASGWFDEAWYREQVAAASGPSGVAAATDGATPADAAAPIGDALEHYLAVGAERGLAPHPLFDPRYYLAHSRRARRSNDDPLVDFFERGADRGDDPHPLFDTEAYLEVAPAAAEHPTGAFGHFLEVGDREGLWPLAPAPGLTPPGRSDTDASYLELARHAQRAHRAVPDFTDVPRSVPTFDHEAAAAFVERMRACAEELPDRPLVSVIMPTRDRAAVLPRAIDSVLAQTYAHLELVVVDDGGSDDTETLVAGYDDPRVTYVRQDHAGVAAARNRGVAASRGGLIAYLDSDNAWVPEFLEVMVAFLVGEGLRGGYAAIEMRRQDGSLLYRGRPLHREMLHERNYIDLNTVVHDRELFAEVGGFDERLRRVVDWDLLLRAAAVTDLGYAPFIGVHYDAGKERGDRITMTETPGYRDVVWHKHLVDVDRVPATVPGRTSVLLASRAHPEQLLRQVATLVDEAAAELEVVAVDDALEADAALRVRLLCEAVGVPLRRIAEPVSLALAYDVAAAMASGDVLVVADPGVRVTGAQLVRLAGEVRAGDAAMVQPTLLLPSGVVRTTGRRLARDGQAVTVGAGLPDQDPALLDDRNRDAVEGHLFAVDAEAFRVAGGLDPRYLRGGADVELSRRLAPPLGVRWCPQVAGVLDPRDTQESWLADTPDQLELRRAHPRSPADALTVGDELGAYEVAGMARPPGARLAGPQRWETVLRRRHGAPRRWAIKTCCPEVAQRPIWGDWHFAQALARALQRLGEEVVVDCRRGWYRDSLVHDDVVLALRGTQRYEPNPAHRNLLWVISHPERVGWDELAAYDRTFAASVSYAEQASRRWSDVAVAPLLQCTDPAVFHPDPDPAVAEDVLFVGNSRGVLRDVVRDAIEAGLEPAVYGGGWQGLVPDRLLRGENIPNEQLRRYYSSAGVVLNDHWEQMREQGFVSNRIFDALACGAQVVSDEIAGLPEELADALHTYRGPDDLHRVVEDLLARSRPDTLAPLQAHTFDARAQALVAAANAVGTSRRPPGTSG